MRKTYNLLGIRKKAILCRTKVMGIDVYTILRPITEKQEQQLDEEEYIDFDGTIVDKSNIFCYGEFNVNSEADLDYIEKFNIIDYDGHNMVYSNYDFDNGTFTTNENGTPELHDCYDAIHWFKFNYLLIGKPKRIIVYKCKKCDL